MTAQTRNLENLEGRVDEALFVVNFHKPQRLMTLFDSVPNGQIVWTRSINFDAQCRAVESTLQ